jgi:acetyltransferase-like isoleucine patch superfamily enzyme
MALPSGVDRAEVVNWYDAKAQLFMVAVKLHNLFYNLLPFFALKNRYLRSIGITIGDRSYLHTWCNFTFPGRLKIGNNCTINFDCYLDTRGKIEIGNNVMIGHCCKIYTAGHDLDRDDFAVLYRSVEMGNNVIIFPNCLIMPGVKIGDNAIVLNGSVVTKNIPANHIVGGNPAKFIRERTANPKYRHDYKYWWINS